MSFSAAFPLQTSQVSSIRILLVEDDPTSRLLLHDYLSHLGYVVCSILSGDNFFPTLNQFCPHLVLLDLKLPKVDGYTLLRDLRQNSAWQHIPVVVVSAYAFKADQQRAFDLGASHYLVKPIDLNVLHQVIAEHLFYTLV
ncbi:response regulator [Oculatella sp. LEGE 06141]|uniref:response regulator n=1 Tax=Oculatella sp. LEGE 06141 TaxID=1828648 RepID=UPI00188055F3|nr:response regulator [Oculatella sp. LEGE 06141]MBE9178119.1 response regulator [Oculatella sp. LEGE 06141]